MTWWVLKTKSKRTNWVRQLKRDSSRRTLFFCQIVSCSGLSLAWLVFLAGYYDESKKVASNDLMNNLRDLLVPPLTLNNSRWGSMERWCVLISFVVFTQWTEGDWLPRLTRLQQKSWQAPFSTTLQNLFHKDMYLCIDIEISFVYCTANPVSPLQVTGPTLLMLIHGNYFLSERDTWDTRKMFI